MKLKRDADDFGMNFSWGPETLEKQGRKIRGKNLLEEFAEKFALNFPEIRETKIANSLQLRSAGPRDQEIGGESRYVSKVSKSGSM